MPYDIEAKKWERKVVELSFPSLVGYGQCCSKWHCIMISNKKKLEQFRSRAGGSELLASWSYISPEAGKYVDGYRFMSTVAGGH